MKVKKSNKILILFSAFVITILAFCLSFAISVVKAEEPPEDPYVTVTSSKTIVDNDEKTITIAQGYEYNLSDLKIEYFDGETTKTLSFSNLKLDDDTNFVVEGSYFHFTVADEYSLKICSTTDEALKDDNVIETYTVKVVKDSVSAGSFEAPKYATYADRDAFEATTEYTEFMTALLKNAKDDNETYSKPIGSGKYITIPSMAKFVSDNTTPFDSLTYIVHYKVDSTDTTYSSGSTKTSVNFQIPVQYAGVYKFWVEFKDLMGNSMSVDEDTQELFTFTFNMDANYPVTVTPTGDTLLTAYINEKYSNASSVFTLKGETSASYTIYFAEKDENVNDYKELDYEAVSENNSSLNLTPDKEGYYKVVCEVKNSSNFTDSAEVYFNAIKKPKTTTESSSFGKWVSEHVLSVVFLGIGLLCLIAIIVLLFIKPKDEDADDDAIVIDKKDNKENK